MYYIVLSIFFFYIYLIVGKVDSCMILLSHIEVELLFECVTILVG